MKQRIHIQLLTPVLETRQQVQTLLEGVEKVHLDISGQTLVDVVATGFNAHAPDVLLVELDCNDAEEMGCISSAIRKNDGHLAVIATAAEASVEHVRSLMRAGVTDFLPQPISRPELLHALETALLGLVPRAPEPARRGRIIAFMGVAGGIGNTTLAIETAAQLLPTKKGPSTAVGLLDFDVQGGNVALSLDITSDLGLGDLIEAQDRLDEDLVAGTFFRHASGLSVLAAPHRILPFEALTPDSIGEILNVVHGQFDYAVIDLPAVWTNWTLTILSQCDALVLVTKLDVTSMARTRQCLDLLKEYGVEDLPMVVVANRFESGWGMGRRRKEAEKGLSRSIDFLVRDDAKTASAARDRGVLLRGVRPRSPIIRDVRAMLAELVNSMHRESPVTARHSATITPMK